MSAKSDKKKGLGRGLSALLADADPIGDDVAVSEKPAKAADRSVPIDLISANPDQPRRAFDDQDLAELADSIQEKGIIQPLILRPDPNNPSGYQIVAGERRWRAAQKAGLHEVPAVIREFDETEVLEIAIIENIQRADLNAIEEAAGFRQLMDRFGHTQEALAKSMGKSRSHIANALRLLNLPDDVIALVRDGKLSAGHARALVTAKEPSALAAMIVSQGLSVRQTEKLAKSSATKAPAAAPIEKDADTAALEADLSAALKMRVKIDHRPDGTGGKLQVTYKSLDDLDGLCQLLSQ